MNSTITFKPVPSAFPISLRILSVVVACMLGACGYWGSGGYFYPASSVPMVFAALLQPRFRRSGRVLFGLGLMLVNLLAAGFGLPVVVGVLIGVDHLRDPIVLSAWALATALVVFVILLDVRFIHYERDVFAARKSDAILPLT